MSADGTHDRDVHGDDPGDEHDHPAHGPMPLSGIDTADLLATVDALASALREYVGTAAGVRAEFGAHEADEDPRILAIESRINSLNAELYDLVHERLGMHSDLTGMSWESDEDAGDDDLPPHATEVETFHLGFLVGPPTGTSDLSMDSVLGILDDEGADITRRLMDSGFDVAEWGASRGAPVLFGDEDDEDDAL